ncbi:NADP-dependent fatty aldehyde dehydrogenase [Rosistilla carotiformis]|uniref:NADP-dependent fatty aldehyde dehydrogenase n=1 Tax=Rosistilla carotiformis TaxID=2528017 RepID=A0A518K159_9BACT|nr:aldehyde dehydrogenase (NADP(+)) [Rosistilla carotiformis]QDV71527.1 NADP-dependent fatty aldehyde dehydrogenase [Rosistilla carotiformis]
MSTTAQSEPVLIAGQWRPASLDTANTNVFQATDPSNMELLSPVFPVSSWQDCDEALNAAAAAYAELRQLPRERIAAFLEAFADRIDAAKDRLVAAANRETGLPASPRLADVELPRTTNQLRLAAAACRSGDWAAATIDSKAGIRSCYQSLGPICVFGPNNFPFAFGSLSGGDFAAAIAAGNPVIGKANSSHPETTKIFAEEAFAALQATDLPTATVQLIYRLNHADGERLVADPRVGATGYTGSRGAGLALKAAADRAGKPIYLELSSVNPVAILPGAMVERGDAIIKDFVGSALMGTGQFCTSPGIILMTKGEDADKFVEAVSAAYQAATPGTLLSPAVTKSLGAGIQTLRDAGAELVCGGGDPVEGRCARSNTLLKTTGGKFLSDPETFQTEAFGNASMVVVADDIDQLTQVIDSLEGNLTGCIYSANDGSDDAVYPQVAFALEPKVGRILNDKMPTGVAVSPAMNHGGPYPSTGHPGFTAVGIPAALPRFAKLTCFDAVRPARLPELLQDKNPTGSTWRFIDGQWSQADV